MTRTARPLQSSLIYIFAALLSGSAAFAQDEPKPLPETKAVASDKSTAYYNFAMGHLYAEMASAYGNRGDYLNQAIGFYREALRLDPSAAFLSEELTDLYIQSGQLSRAVTEAEDLLKRSPDNLDARRMLGRIYTRLIGDPQAKLDEKMIAKAIEQYKIITDKDKNDLESRLLLGRLYRFAHNSVDAEKVYKSVLEVEPDNEEALTSLAGVYSGMGDTKAAVDMLRRAADKEPNVRSLSALAGFYEQINDYASAAETLKRMMPLAPDSGKVKRALAQDLLYGDKVDEAFAIYQDLAKEDPHDADVQLSLSRIYRERHDFTASAAALAVAKASDPERLDIRYEEVELLSAQDKNAEAITTLKAILTDKTIDKTARGKLTENLGKLYKMDKKYPEAIAAFREMAEIDPDKAQQASVQVVDTYRTAKNLPEARKESDAALKKFPKDRAIVLEHAFVLGDMGKTNEAVSEIRSLMGTAKDRETLLLIAQFYEKGKKYSEEGKVLDEAEALAGSKQEKETVQFARGSMYDKMKNYDSAEAEFRKVIAVDPDNAIALNYLGYMLADRDVRLDEAQKLIKRAVDLEPANGAYLDSLGWVYYRQGMLDQAEEQLRKALEKIGTDPTVHDHLGDVYAKAGKIKEAITQWQASLKEYETTPPSDVDPAEVAKVTKKLESARVRIAKEQQKNP